LATHPLAEAKMAPGATTDPQQIVMAFCYGAQVIGQGFRAGNGYSRIQPREQIREEFRDPDVVSFWPGRTNDSNSNALKDLIEGLSRDSQVAAERAIDALKKWCQGH
jgi:hypothetical protein